MSTYPSAEGLQVDERLAGVQREKILTSPTSAEQNGWLEKNDKVLMEYGDREVHDSGDGGGEDTVPVGLDGASKEKRYCGLRPKMFWVVFVILLVVIIGGAVGGGVGGSLAGKSAVGGDNLLSTTSPAVSATTSSSITSSSTTSQTTSTPNTPTCPPTLACSDVACLGFNPPSNSNCISGNFAQCPCTSICPALPLPCSSCNGSSAILLCGLGDFHGCYCKSDCGAIDGPCRNCAGKSDPKGGRGVCTSREVNGCGCVSECGPVNGPCDDNGCFGKNGFCTQGTVWGCACG